MRVLLLIFAYSAYGQQLEKSRSVWVEQGLVRGKIYNLDGRHVQIFRGIPYAEPPVGDLRFRKPVKKARWNQELPAVEYGPPCLQFMDFHRNDRFSGANMKRESEDCLYLNVFSPYDHEDESKTYPILMWIHGGSFLAGSGATGIDIETLAQNVVFKGVTVVTINYRLGPLGFIAAMDGDKVEANFGIWDMVMALQWIQANIKQFNGDPTRVTVMGESAGGAAASMLALTPKTQNLVHQAIIMSGSSQAGWAIQRHGTPSWSVDYMTPYLRCEKKIAVDSETEIVREEFTREQLDKMHCNYQEHKITCLDKDISSSATLDCMRKQLNFSSNLFRRGLSYELGVSKMIVDNDLVPSSGIDLVKNNARIPIMIGVAKKEWAHKKAQFYNMHAKTQLTQTEAAASVLSIVENSYHALSPQKLSNSTLHLIANASFVRYVDNPNKTYVTSEVLSALQTMEADIEFVAPCQREIDAYAGKEIPVYAYSFDYQPDNTIYEEERKTYSIFGKEPVVITRKEQYFQTGKLEAFHGLDHGYIFSRGYSSNFEVKPYTKRDETMAKLFSNSITNFIKTGAPSTPRFEWPVFSANASQYASLDLPPRLITGEVHWPNPGFWNGEVDFIAQYALRGNEQTDVDPDADLTNEERVELGAYRRAWLALWLLVLLLSSLLWGVIGFVVWKKSCSHREKPYDNIVIAR